MEHAVRKHCKVKYDEDPAFYQKLSDKLEELIQHHKENWDKLVEDLFELRKEAEAGRNDEMEGVSRKAAPFYDLIGQAAFGDGVPDEHAARIKQLVADVFGQLQGTIDIVNFWNNTPEVSRLRGELSDLMLATGIDEIIEHSDKIVTEITQLAKKRHKDIVE